MPTTQLTLLRREENSARLVDLSGSARHSTDKSLSSLVGEEGSRVAPRPLTTPVVEIAPAHVLHVMYVEGRFFVPKKNV